MNNPISYERYDRISDNVLFLGQSTNLKFTVQLSKKNPEYNNRFHFHREYKYNSQYGDLYSIKRDFDYFLSIEKLDKTYNTNISVMIRVQDIMLLKYKLNEVIKWFTDDTFCIKNDKLIIHKKEPVIVDGLPCNQYIQFDPIIIEYENSIIQGIRMTLGNPEVYTDISIQNFYAFYYTIDTFNMYQAAQLMVNYLGRPELGFNLSVIDDKYTDEKHSGGVSGKNRQIGIFDNKRSFFD